jgi:hypothetical protein
LFTASPDAAHADLFREKSESQNSRLRHELAPVTPYYFLQPTAPTCPSFGRIAPFVGRMAASADAPRLDLMS